MLSSFIPTDKMKFSYKVADVSNRRRLDESGDLNSHDGWCSSSTTRFRHPLKSHQNFDIWFSQKWGKGESPSSSSDSFPKDYCWLSCFLLLSTLYWLGLGSSNSPWLDGISGNGIMYDVESSFSESVVSHLAWILSCVLFIEDTSFLCLCFGPAAGAALSVTVRYMEEARRKQIGRMEARCRLVTGELYSARIERENWNLI